MRKIQENQKRYLVGLICSVLVVSLGLFIHSTIKKDDIKLMTKEGEVLVTSYKNKVEDL